jgi:glutathione S-transferase
MNLVSVALALAVASAVAAWAWENARRKTHPVAPGYRPEITIPPGRTEDARAGRRIPSDSGLARDSTPPASPPRFELYHNAFSLCSMKTRVCLAELGIAYRSHHVDLIETGAYENIRRPFLAVNPGGTVPVLVHDGHPIYESHEQIRYAAAHAPETSPALVPADATLREQMERWIDRSSITADPLGEGHLSAGNAVPGLTLPLFAAMIDVIPYWRIFEGVLFHFDKRRPFMFATFKLVGLERLDTLAPAMKLLAKSRRQMHEHLDAFEAQLDHSGGPWLLGPQLTLADVGWLAIFERLAQADVLHVFAAASHRPRCAAYWERLRARPSYREAILDHAHPSITRGTRRLKKAKAKDPSLRAALEGTDGPTGASSSRQRP